MATITKEKLSGSTNGRGIKVAATSTPGTTIHTAVANATDWDEVWIYASNTHTGSVTLTLEWGNAAVDDNIKVVINSNETALVAPGLLIQNSLVVKAFASVTNKINIFGYVNRMDY
jgi:hypothetical protein